MAAPVTAIEPVAGAVDHLADALARLPEQFRGKENWTAALTVLCNPIQHLENVLLDVLAILDIDEAEGAQLTVIGKLVGQLRHGITDDAVFRRYVRARIAQKRSRGTGEDLIRVARLVVGDDAATIVIAGHGIATVTVTVAGAAVTDAVADILLAFLRESVAAGARVILETSTSAPAETFAFDGGTGGGFGSLTSATLATDNTFIWHDEDGGVDVEITVTAGTYSYLEIVVEIMTQMPVGRVFDIADVDGDLIASFVYDDAVFSVTWDPPGADSAIELRDILGWTADIEDAGPGDGTAPNPFAYDVGGRFSSARE
jgi:hypothetical protein